MEAQPQQDVAEQADAHHFADLEEVVVGGIDADADEEHRARVEELVGDRQHLHPDADQRHVEQNQHDVADPEAGNETPENVRMLRDQLRSGHDALDHQRAEEERHHGVAGDAQTHGRDEVALHRGVGRGFRADHAFDQAGAEFLRMFGDSLFGGVSDEGGDGRAGAGNERAQAADDGAAPHREEGAFHIGLGRPHVLEGDVGIFGVDRRHLIDAVHELGDAEQSQRQRDQLDAVIELGHAKRVAFRAGFQIGADRAEEQSQHRHGDALDRRAARQGRAGQQAEQHQRADFGRAELQRSAHQ